MQRFTFDPIRLVAVVIATASITGAARPARGEKLSDELTDAKQEILDHVSGADLSSDEIEDWISFGETVKKHAKGEYDYSSRLKRILSNPWVVFGLIAQVAFMMRFVLQIIASERRKRSYVPVAFWYFSLGGGTMLLVYALHLRDPVFVLGQGLGCLIYLRNLTLIYRRRAEASEQQRDRAIKAATKSPTTAT